MKILVLGGAGYIGSHFCHLAAEKGHEVVVLDNFSSGYRCFVKKFRVFEGDVADLALLDHVLGEEEFDAVCHFAGRISVAESVAHPELYIQSNRDNTEGILVALQSHAVPRIIFSSTAAVYSSDASGSTLSESAAVDPISPYGVSKLLAETVIKDWVDANDKNRAVVFRYFNAAGAGVAYEIGEAHDPETHLIPNAIYAGLRDSADPLKVYGNDYETRDGTCVRDFIHVLDIASAHLLALDLMDRLAARWNIFNLGSGAGFTVAEVIKECEAQLGLEIPKIYGPRREGDLATLVASCERARNVLGWHANHSSVENIVKTAIEWHLNIQPRLFS
jgi:UDP-glucose 4-epimerase